MANVAGNFTSTHTPTRVTNCGCIVILDYRRMGIFAAGALTTASLIKMQKLLQHMVSLL